MVQYLCVSQSITCHWTVNSLDQPHPRRTHPWQMGSFGSEVKYSSENAVKKLISKIPPRITSPNLCIPFRLKCLCNVQYKGPVEDIWEEKENTNKNAHMSKCDSLWALMTALYSEHTFLKHNFIYAILYAFVQRIKTRQTFGGRNWIELRWGQYEWQYLTIININRALY